ncbi:MAG: uridine kinase [Halobacteriovoraceae bacterium]|nr:uridine kinase [Halobacteriovoraceae bacterium]|tara:strand:- start:33421 stop:34098 length:678 start_codon:yes stop_codon:yes gene_type:complete
MTKLIGVAGGSGSGKTTFAKKLIHLVDRPITLLHMDSYYLPSQPTKNYTPSGKPNFDHPEAFDWELLRHHLTELKSGRDISVPVYDFKSSSRTQESVHTPSTPVIIFEGIFSLFDAEIRDMLSIKTFLHVDSDIRFTRRLNRDVQERGRSLDSVINQYYETVRPMHQKFLEPQKQYADFIVGEETDVAAGILASRLNDFLRPKSPMSSFNHFDNKEVEGTQVPLS